MSVTMKQMSLIISAFGVLSFILGVVAENKKPASGTPITRKDVVICKYPSDPTVVLGYLSVAFLVASTVTGYLSLFYPYKGKSVPSGVLFRSTSFVVFFNIALFTAGLGLTLLLWPTITEQLHLSHNIHHNLETKCPTAKTGLLGGGAFVSLDASLSWLVALMLAGNAREDFFEEKPKGEACLLPVAKGTTCANYARCVNQILQSLSNMLMDSWELWYSFRLLCEHHSQLSVALDIVSSLPTANSLGRWFGEPVRTAIISTDVVDSGKSVHGSPRESSDLLSSHNDTNIEGEQTHPLRLYFDYFDYLYQKMGPLPEQERFELGYRDFYNLPCNLSWII